MPAEGYQQALMRRLGMIQDLGTSATAIAKAQQAPMFDGSFNNMPSPQFPQATQPNGSGFGAFVGAIAGQESGGNYGAVNKNSGALGKYQIMPGNIQGAGRGWDYEILGRDVSTSQFLKSPQIQEAIAQGKLQSYYNKYGPAGAAVAWYAGPGTVSGYMKNPNAYTNPQGAYPSIAQYVNQILGRMG